MKEPKFIIVVGASAGGYMAVSELISQFKKDMDAAVLVVFHVHKISTHEVVLQRLQAQTHFTCKLAEQGEVVKKGFIYISVPDQHLLVKKGKILLGQGPHENRWRPSIDVLFRSAAAHYNARVIGLVLSGLLSDGTSGMAAIKRCGGTCIVQDPNEAEYPSMIESVLQEVAVDFCVPLEEMGTLLEEITRNSFEPHAVPADIQEEARIAEQVAVGIDNVKPIGESSAFVCPDCGGLLWEMVNDHVTRYRCYTGHVFNQDELLIRKSQALESTLWTALRILEERKNLLDKIARQEAARGWKQAAALKTDRATELEEHIQRLKQVLLHTKND